MSLIQLRSGTMFDLSNPDPDRIRLDDIAWSLARVNRYTGHTSVPLSVAEHSVHVSLLCAPQDAKAGLLHDAAEAYVGDMAAPLKKMVANYRAIEERVRAAIAKRFGLPIVHKLNRITDEYTTERYEDPSSVRAADMAMLAHESRECMPYDHSLESVKAWDECLAGVLYDPAIVTRVVEHLGRPPEQAQKFFLDRAEELGVR